MAERIDNRRQRIETLKKVISGLHEGVPEDEVRRQLQELVQQTDASEIAAMEQQLMDEGMPAERIMAMCDMHSQVVGDILTERPSGPVAPGHPVDTFRRENEALAEAVADFRRALAAAAAGDDGESVGPDAAHGLLAHFSGLMDVDRHYSRKENLLFPYLEKHGITGPSKVMWGKDDEARELLRGAGRALQADETAVRELRAAIESAIEPALQALEEMIHKEDNILLPMALDALTAEEWGQIWEQTPEIGYCLVAPGDEYRAPAPAAAEGLLTIEGADPAAAPTNGNGPAFVVPNGSLTAAQLQGLFGVLPMDVTFVDVDDRVRYFSEGAGRIFDRSRAILGRQVQHCHPPASVDVVVRILDDFRAGREDSCSFWIEFKGQFVYIRYFAVRDEQGQYLGTLEVTQDLTEARALEGERRLLEYDSA